jgi:MSHA biogenesis protein MshM
MAAHSVPAYLQHRLATAALDELTDVKLFDAAAVRALSRYSGGVPRLVNVLAHKSLMLVYGENARRVKVRHVRMAAADTPGVQVRPSWWQRLRARWTLAEHRQRTARDTSRQRMAGHPAAV